MFHTVLFFMTICEGTWDFHGGNCGNFAFPVVTRRFQKSEEITQGGSEVNRLKKMTSNTHTLLDGKENTQVGFGHCNTCAVNFELISPKVVRTQGI